MKWGVRKKREYVSSYTRTQRKQDRALYGKGSERRIEDRIRKGENLVTARHHEIVRRGRIKRAKMIASTAAILAAEVFVMKTLGSSSFQNAVYKYAIPQDPLFIRR